MKKLIFVMLVLLLVVPAASSYSATISYGSLWSENRYHESTAASEYGMLADVGVSTHAYDIYAYSSSWIPAQQYQLLTPYVSMGNLGAGGYATTADGYPPPGGSYEARDIYFFINEDGTKNPLSNPYILKNYPSGTYSQIPLVENVTFSMGSDTLVRWDGIVDPNFGDGVNDQYRVRIIDKATTGFLLDSGRIDINSSNEYEYNLGDLSAYGDIDSYWIGIEARDQGELGLVNRSRYYASSPVVPEPTTMLLLGAGLVGLAGYGRKRFKK